jgi:glycosyltransferase involved in cell wall biosynthesis
MSRQAGRGRQRVRQLRVALDTTYAGVNPTGVGLYSRWLAEALGALAAGQHLTLKCYGPACRREAERAGATSIAQEWPIYTHGVLPVRLSAFRPNVAHSTSHIGPLWGPGKLVVTIHDLIFLRRPEDYNRAWLGLTMALLPRVLRRASAVACDSKATREDVVRRLNLPRGKTVVIYPGVDSKPDGSAMGSPPLAYPYILCLGPWVLRKNLEVVLRAFAQIAPQHGDLRLVITGGPVTGVQSYSKDLLKSFVPPELRSRVVLPGFVTRSELARWVMGAGVLAYPSVDEGFGLPPLEAMAAGVPVVVADTPAVVEVTGGAALVAPSSDASAWASRLSLVLERRDVAERLRAAGLRQSARFTWEACATKFAQLYRRL